MQAGNCQNRVKKAYRNIKGAASDSVPSEEQVKQAYRNIEDAASDPSPMLMQTTAELCHAVHQCSMKEAWQLHLGGPDSHNMERLTGTSHTFCISLLQLKTFVMLRA